MKINWKKSVTSVVLTTSLLTFTAAVYADGVPAQQSVMFSDSAASYLLTDNLEVQVKSVLNERVTEGTRIGVVVRMKNTGTAITRVPDTYELRVKTADGVEYTLQGSASNARSIQPKATQELSYLSVIDRTDEVTLSEINWTDVDVYVYPKLETVKLTVPVTVEAWKGSDMPITDESMVRKWGETFQVLAFKSPLDYKPVSIDKQITANGATYSVQLLVTNSTSQSETIPDFIMEGRADAKVFSGTRAEQGPVVLEANGQTYIHYVIQTEMDTALTSVNVLTQESFAEAGGAPGSLVTYNVGRVSILLPTQAENVAASLAPYNLGDLMQFDALSDAIHPDFQVSMVEFRMSPNEVEGSNSVTAKFKIFNKSDRPMAVPEFQADLVSSDGYLYAGSRQTIASQSILPNSGFVIGYSFILPSTETGQGLGIKIQDAKTAAPAKTTIAAYSASLQEGIDDKAFTIYPFDVKIPYYTIAPMYNVGNNGKYTYKLRLDLDVQRDPAIQVDNNFSKLYFEVYDTIGRQIGGTEASFVGLNRLVTGENNIYLNSTSEQQEQRITVKVYEKFTTPSGDAKRLLGELHN